MAEISVIMGVLCQSEKLPLLERAIKSMLCQSFNDIELVICADGSDSAVTAYLEESARIDSRIKLVGGEEKITLPQKLNCCLKHSDGRFIARMDDDDFSMPDRLEKQMNFLREHTDISFVGCCVDVFDGTDIIGAYIHPMYPSVRDFYFSQPYVHPTLLFRREALEAVNGYSEEKSCILCEDYDILLRLAAEGLNGANLQEHLLIYTVSPKLSSKRNFRARRNECVTRYRRFKQLGVLPKAFIYVIKPIVVGLIPDKLLGIIKKKRLKDKS